MSPVKSYFSFQFVWLKRQLADFGVNPILGFVLFIVVFIGGSIFLFSKTSFANYLYVLVALSMISRKGEVGRINFLEFTYSKGHYLLIRFFETLFIVLPFLVFLLIKSEIFAATLLVLLSQSLAFFNRATRISTLIPTPFSKRPFEFVVGFRTWVIGFMLAYFLTGMSILYQNLNLGLFSLAFIFLICLSFYNEPEEKFYVWVHNSSPRKFLLDKIKTAFMFVVGLSLPIIITLFVFLTPSVYEISGILIVGFVYLITIILAKYSDYPNRMNLPQGILLGLSILLPPFLLLLIPFFYCQSVKRLKVILV